MATLVCSAGARNTLGPKPVLSHYCWPSEFMGPCMHGRSPVMLTSPMLVWMLVFWAVEGTAAGCVCDCWTGSSWGPHCPASDVGVLCLELLFWKMISTTLLFRTSMGLSMFTKSLRLVLDNLIPLCTSVINVPNSLSFFSLFPTSTAPYKLSLS